MKGLTLSISETNEGEEKREKVKKKKTIKPTDSESLEKFKQDKHRKPVSKHTVGKLFKYLKIKKTKTKQTKFLEK